MADDPIISFAYTGIGGKPINLMVGNSRVGQIIWTNKGWAVRFGSAPALDWDSGQASSTTAMGYVRGVEKTLFYAGLVSEEIQALARKLRP